MDSKISHRQRRPVGYQNASLFCGEAGQEVIDLILWPLGLWFKQADGWPVAGIP